MLARTASVVLPELNTLIWTVFQTGRYGGKRGFQLLNITVVRQSIDELLDLLASYQPCGGECNIEQPSIMRSAYFKRFSVYHFSCHTRWQTCSQQSTRCCTPQYSQSECPVLPTLRARQYAQALWKRRLQEPNQLLCFCSRIPSPLHKPDSITISASRFEMPAFSAMTYLSYFLKTGICGLKVIRLRTNNFVLERHICFSGCLAGSIIQITD